MAVTRGRGRIVALAMLVATVTAVACMTRPLFADDADAPNEGLVRVGKVVLGDAGVAGTDMDVCFSAGFLTTVARVGEIEMHRAFVRTALDSDEVFEFPFLVLAGQGDFTLTDAQRDRLGHYIDRGGFVLASAGCSNAAWAESFARVAEALWGEHALRPVTPGHAIFHTLYDIDHVDVRVGDPERAIWGYEVDGSVRLVFSPIGLNDTDRAGGGCCCCGGSEIRNARLINANILAYALTH